MYFSFSTNTFKKKIITFLLFQPAFFLAAQNNPPINFYNFSTHIDSTFKSDTVRWKDQNAATEYSFIGEYHKSLIFFNQINFATRRISSQFQLTEEQKKSKAILSSYKPTSAKKYILQQAKNTRIVIINEAHHLPLHRVFAESLLADLKMQGYNFIGFEGLSSMRTLFQYKYPVSSIGIYTNETCFGNLIRKSMQLGFTPFGYEPEVQGGPEREIGQAENIKSIIDKNPHAKFIIYCGYSHAIEDSTHNNWGLAMAGRLKRMTGIDPLTIDQVELTETGSPQFDNSYRQVIDLSYPAVLVDEKGNAFGKAHEYKWYDANVYHPTTKYIDGRPVWLYYDNKESVNLTDKITIAYPCLVFAYKEGEDIRQAVPVDVIELIDKNDTKKLVLNKNGRYKILIKNRSGENQFIQL